MKKVEQQEEGEEGDFLACHAKGGGSFCRRHVTESQSAASGSCMHEQWMCWVSQKVDFYLHYRVFE